MNNITVTITGADDNTSIYDLGNMSKKKFQLTVMREGSEAENHIFVDAVDLCEAIKIFRRDYPHMKDYVLASHKVIKS